MPEGGFFLPVPIFPSDLDEDDCQVCPECQGSCQCLSDYQGVTIYFCDNGCDLIFGVSI